MCEITHSSRVGSASSSTTLFTAARLSENMGLVGLVRCAKRYGGRQEKGEGKHVQGRVHGRRQAEAHLDPAALCCSSVMQEHAICRPQSHMNSPGLCVLAAGQSSCRRCRRCCSSSSRDGRWHRLLDCNGPLLDGGKDAALVGCALRLGCAGSCRISDGPPSWAGVGPGCRARVGPRRRAGLAAWCRAWVGAGSWAGCDACPRRAGVDSRHACTGRAWLGWGLRLARAQSRGCC